MVFFKCSKSTSAFFLFVLILLLNSSNISAAGKGKLRGFVTDSTKGEAIPYANLALKATPFGSPSDTKGYYFVPSIPAGQYVLVISCLGYQTQEKNVEIKENEITQVDIKLVPTSIKLQEISVIGQKSVRENEIDLGLQKINASELKMIPSGLESDIFKALQSTPGVSSTGDITARHYVRGGSSNQNLVLLNGVSVYNPFHALGIYSAIDPEMISVVEFYKGGFGPEFGGRLSSVMNIITRDGNKNRLEASGTAGLLSGKASVEGPIPGGSFIMTGRKSYYSKSLSKYFNGKDTPFDFYDASFKANFSLPGIMKNGKFIVHGFLSGDKIKNNDPMIEDYDLKNNILGVNWYQVWSSPLFSVVSVSYSGFDGQVIPNLSQAKTRSNTVSDISTNWAFTYIYDSKDEIDFGLDHKYLKTDLKLQNLFNQESGLKKDATALAAYMKYKFYRYENFGIDLGMRLNLLSLAKKIPLIIEPRFNFTWRLSPLFSLKAALGRFSQEVTTLANENEIVSVFEPWTILPDNLASSEATHMLLGFQAFLSENFNVEVESYYKSLKFLAEPNMRKFLPGDPDYANIDGQAYGIELLAKYQSNDFYMKTGYSLSWSYKLNNGIKYFPRYDYRHSLNVLLGYNLGWGFSADASWTFNSGMPGSTITGFYERFTINDVSSLDPEITQPAVLWDRINMKRLPLYHRLDLGLSKKLKLDFADFEINASVINVYDRKNLFYIDLKTGKKVYMLPFFPSISIKASI